MMYKRHLISYPLVAAMFAFMFPQAMMALSVSSNISVSGTGNVEQQDDVVATDSENVPEGFEVKDGAIQLNTQEDFDKWAKAVNEATSLYQMNVDLNTNIVVISGACVIESYNGVFDGNYHTIDMQLTREVSDDGLAFFRDLNGTLQNVYFTGTLEGYGKFIATVAQDLNGGSLVKNVHSSVNIISHINGDGTHGGIAARCEGSATLKDIIYSGTMYNAEEGTSNCGGLIGWVTYNSTFENCLMIGDMSEINDEGCNTIGRNQGNIDGKNLFATMQKNETPASCTIVTMDEMKSGAICYKLNGDQSEITWYQNLGEGGDAFPVFENTHKQVYAVGTLNCDGSIIGDATFNNESGSEIPDHAYLDGICENCGKMQPGFITMEDGWYLVSNGAQLVYIANYATVNPTINIKITEDIDMTGCVYTPITNYYSGIFDGQGHTISNLVINRPDVEMQALIGLAGTCTLKNLTLDHTCSITGGGYSAGFVGESGTSGTITMENLFMHGDVVANGPNGAAIYACNMGSVADVVMKNCGMSGNVVGQNEAGLMTGWFGGRAIVTNCWAVGYVEGCDANEAAVFARPASGDTFVNCYSIQGNRVDVGHLNEDAALSGELTWKLNGSSFVNPTWFQTLEEGDQFPSLDSSRGVVYPTINGYASMDPNDANDFASFVKAYSESAAQFLSSGDVSKYGAASLVAEYAELAAAYESVTDMDAFLPLHEAEQAKKAEIEASIVAYKNYEKVMEDIVAELQRRDDFGGEERDFLEDDYMYGGLAPGENEKAPNGSYDYIMENRHLTTAEVNAEAEYAKELLRLAITNGYMAGADITDMLTNANFANSFNGWKGTYFTSIQKSNREGSNMYGVEGFGSGAYHIYQEIIAGKSGVYELKVGGAWRPFNEWNYNSIEYYPYIYINGNANYIQSDIEDYIPINEAQDGVNCNLNPDWIPDLTFSDENGNVLGYVMHGIQSVCDALEAGRYDNRILINLNAGDTLRLGINMPRSEYSQSGNEWIGFGDIHLFYQGELDEAEVAVDRVLENMLERADKLMGIQYSSDANYMKFPNWSQALKDRVNASIEKAAGAADVATKYEVIKELSATFMEIIDCKKAYREYFSMIENIYTAAYNAAEIDPNCSELATAAETFLQEALVAYETGSMSTEEARECAIAKELDVIPTIDENGVYHIANTAQLAYFSAMANSTTTDSNGKIYNVVLEADVSMNTEMIINDFYGTFDGRFHTLTVSLQRDQDGVAPFNALRSGATVKNLTINGTITTSYKFAASVAAHSYVASNIDCVQSYVNIITGTSGDGTHGGILAVNDSGNGYITNSMFAGSISGPASYNGGFVGWANGSVTVENCLMVADITTDDVGSNTIGRANTFARDCYYVTPYGATPDGTIQLTPEQVENGYATYMLNKESSRPDVIWRQNLGEDAIPTQTPTHKIVYQLPDGTFTNEMLYEIQQYKGSEDDPFIVKSAQDMAALRNVMSPGRVNYVKMEADIDMAGITDWYPLNMAEDEANGHQYQNIIDFDGQGHIISNFTCTTADGSYNSFFGILNGDVRNVGFKDANVSCTASGTGILAGYMGHDQYVGEDNSKKTSSLTNVWVSGKLNVGTAYAGGMIGNIGGPSVIRNCYTNVDITGTADYAGGLVGRIRDQLSIEQAYAAGPVNVTGANVGGIIGGGQLAETAPGSYNHIAVWNNTDHNFGHTAPASDTTLPAADLLDLVFNTNGTIIDQSPMQNPVNPIGVVDVRYNEDFGCNSYFSKGNNGDGISFLMIEYPNNNALKRALADGYTMETTFAIRGNNYDGAIKPFCSTDGGGFGFEILNTGQIKHVVYTNLNGSRDYRHAFSPAYAKMDTYYHVVGVYNSTAGTVSVFVNGANKDEVEAGGELTFISDPGSQWIGVGADPSGTNYKGESAADFEIISARIYDEALSDAQVKALYYKQQGINFFTGDKVENISYFDGSNFAGLQQVVVDWGKPWICDMQEGSYPTFDSTETGIQSVTDKKNHSEGRIYNINGIRVEKTGKGLYIIDGKKVMVK